MIEEVQQVHSRLLKCGLVIEDARAYWGRIRDLAQQGDSAPIGAPTATIASTSAPPPSGAPERISPSVAFESYWFGSKSLARVEVLLQNFRHRFEAFPPSLEVLGSWPQMSPDTRKLVCHWHLQLSDPLYRRFTGGYLVDRRDGGRAGVHKELVVRWLADEVPAAWTHRTRIEMAGKLLSAAYAAGLVGSNRDPRPLALPRVEDVALEYGLHLLRGVRIEGNLLANPYLASVGLDASTLDERLSRLPSLRFSRQAGLVDFGWRFPDLGAWAAASLPYTQATIGATP